MDNSWTHRTWFGLLLAAPVLAGCSGSEFSGDVRVPADQQTTLTAAAGTSGTISLPADRGFNIHIKKSSQEPGPAGTAISAAQATTDGHASCHAEAKHGGLATAEFNIGHRFANQADAARSATVELAYELQQEVTASAEPTARTIATGQVLLLVLDSRKHSIAKVTIAQVTSDDAQDAASSRDRRKMPIVMRPNETYDVMLFGQVSARADTGQEAAVRLNVRELTMHLTFSPATQPASP